MIQAVISFIVLSLFAALIYDTGRALSQSQACVKAAVESLQHADKRVCQ